jgi:hypothetical protein
MATVAEKAHLTTAVAERVKRSIAILASDHAQNQFSGVFVCYEGRVVLVTASHCLADVGDAKTLKIATYGHMSGGVPIGDLASVRVRMESSDPAPREDIAAFAIPGSLVEELGVVPVGQEDCSSRDLNPGRLVVLPGFPSELLTVVSSSPVAVRPTPFIFFSNVAKRSPDPEELTTPFDPQVDVFVEYSPERLRRSEDEVRMRSIHPRGFSGAGLFSVPGLADGKLWSPSGVKLAAVQSSYLPVSGLLRAKRIDLLPHLMRYFSE